VYVAFVFFVTAVLQNTALYYFCQSSYMSSSGAMQTCSSC